MSSMGRGVPPLISVPVRLVSGKMLHVTGSL
eukprot:CAMPEP_0172686586 /NCGR_PEP_ID=MMETSP1074-20121228/21048_1 /TAXON_ID=2916 /ORGANISM="Ceratium fusus, Strain PA161109" /LENGTH=30 /DNA_ID= /DNA_START= /DNA_END= /DNA_ORIENTATION=